VPKSIGPGFISISTTYSNPRSTLKLLTSIPYFHEQIKEKGISLFHEPNMIREG